MQKIVRQLGPKCCESYILLGNEKGHALRSNHIEFEGGDHGIWCVFDGVVLPTLIDTLVNAGRNRVQPVCQSSAHQFQYQFNYGNAREGEFVYAVVKFFEPEAFNLEAEEVGRPFNAEEFASLPPVLAKIGKALSAIDFQVVAPSDLDEFHAHSLRTITLVRGRRIVPGKPALGGVTVTLNYIV